LRPDEVHPIRDVPPTLRLILEVVADGVRRRQVHRPVPDLLHDLHDRERKRGKIWYQPLPDGLPVVGHGDGKAESLPGPLLDLRDQALSHPDLLLERPAVRLARPLEVSRVEDRRLQPGSGKDSGLLAGEPLPLVVGRNTARDGDDVALAMGAARIEVDGQHRCRVLAGPACLVDRTSGPS
jgi:hypothetical protein